MQCHLSCMRPNADGCCTPPSPTATGPGPPDSPICFLRAQTNQEPSSPLAVTSGACACSRAGDADGIVNVCIVKLRNTPRASQAPIGSAQPRLRLAGPATVHSCVQFGASAYCAPATPVRAGCSIVMCSHPVMKHGQANQEKVIPHWRSTYRHVCLYARHGFFKREARLVTPWPASAGYPQAKC